MTAPTINAQDAVTLSALEAALAEGHILHVRAARLSARRTPRRDAAPAVDFTLGPDARGGFLVVDYARIPSGEDERHESGEAAARAARRMVGWDRMAALRSALVAITGEPEPSTSHGLEAACTVERGARMRRAFAGRRPLRAPLLGGCGVKVSP